MKKILKKFKCGLYVLSFALLLTVLFLGFSDNTNAWTGDLTKCTELYQPWEQMLENYPAFMSSVVHEFQEQQDINILSNDSSFIVFGTTVGSTPYLTIRATEKPYRFTIFEDSNDDRRIRIYSDDNHTTRSSEHYYWGSSVTAINNGYNQEEYTFNEQMNFAGGIQFVPHGQSFTNQDAACIYAFKNVEYHSGYTGTVYDEFDTGELNEEKPPDCSPFDFGCWLTGLVDMVGETFGTLFEAIGKFFTWLFVPDSENLQTQLESYVDTLEDRLGILWIPFDLLTKFLETFISGNPENWVQPNHTYCRGGGTTTLFGHSVQIYDLIPYCKVILNTNTLPQGYSFTPVYPLVELVMNFFRMSIFLAVCGLFYHKVKELLQK